MSNVSALVEIPVLFGDRLELAAGAARLPPDVVDELAPAVNPLVGEGVNKLKILDSVILLIAVLVVDKESLWHRTMMLSPDTTMLKGAVNSDITFLSDASSSVLSAFHRSVTSWPIVYLIVR